MDAQKAIDRGYLGCGEVAQHSTANYLRDGAGYAPCDLETETHLLADDIEHGRWEKADNGINFILNAVKGVLLTTRGVEWATWIGMAQKMVARAGATIQ